MAPKTRKTRHSSGEAFCPPSALPEVNQLYTNKDILAAILMELDQNPEAEIRGIAKRIEPLIRYKWLEVNPRLALIQADSMVNKMVKLHDTAQQINGKRITAKKKKFFMDNLEKIFDILTCQCTILDCDPSVCDPPCDIPHIQCLCLKKFKIPIIELAFIKDQRDKIGLHGGKMVMDGVDKVVAKQQEDTNKKKESAVLSAKENEEQKTIEKNTRKKKGTLREISDDPIDDNDEDSSFMPPPPEKVKDITTTDLREYVSECVRYQVSDRAAVALYNAALSTIGSLETNKIVDKSKYRREKAKFGGRQREKQKLENKDGFSCIGSDGKRNKKTRVRQVQIINNKEVEKFLRKTQEHIVYTSEPGGEYLDHSEIEEGKGSEKDLAEDFFEVLVDNNSVDTLEAVLCDGTNVNVGNRTGLIAFLERTLKRRLLWLVCQLHGNELPLRHVFDHLDGGLGTSGPTTFKGPLGIACTGDEIHLKPVVNFSVIPSSLKELPESVRKDLSRDQELLYGYALGIMAGILPETLIKQLPGPINHARWLTLAIRLMVIYTRTEEPNSSLIKITSFIVQVYVPMWFLIKQKNKFWHGPANLFEQMKLIMTTQPQEIQDVAKKTVQRNAFFAEPGMILTCMLASDDKVVRKKAVKKIKETRKNPPKSPRAKLFQGMRKFVVPELKWKAKSWDETIDWKKVKVFEPYLLEKRTLEEIEAATESPLELPPYSLHSQSVERAVKLVTTASQNVVGQESRHQYCLSILASRKARGAEALETKSKYKMDKNVL